MDVIGLFSHEMQYRYAIGVKKPSSSAFCDLSQAVPFYELVLALLDVLLRNAGSFKASFTH